MHLSIASWIKSHASSFWSRLFSVSRWFKVIWRYCCGQLQVIIWYLNPMHIKSYNLSILLLFNLIMDEWANFSKICFVDKVEYMACGLNSSMTKDGEYIARTTSCKTFLAFSSWTDCAWSLWFNMYVISPPIFRTIKGITCNDPAMTLASHCRLSTWPCEKFSFDYDSYWQKWYPACLHVKVWGMMRSGLVYQTSSDDYLWITIYFSFLII